MLEMSAVYRCCYCCTFVVVAVGADMYPQIDVDGLNFRQTPTLSTSLQILQNLLLSIYQTRAIPASEAVLWPGPYRTTSGPAWQSIALAA